MIIIMVVVVTIVMHLPKETNQVDFAIPVDHRMKIKESENVNKYLDLAREQKITVKYVSDCDST